jgi:hypothetical protein
LRNRFSSRAIFRDRVLATTNHELVEQNRLRGVVDGVFHKR